MRFSIITSSFNAEAVIGRTIESVLKQNYYDYEYIFVDGGSTDRTNVIIDSYKEQFEQKNIPVIHISEKDRGISDAFAKGVNHASGEIVVILNAADEMLPGTLQFLDSNFDDNIDVLYGNIIWHDEKRGIEYIRRSKDVSHLDELKYTMVVMHPATYIKKTAYEKYGNYDPEYKYAMDTELVCRMYKRGARFRYVDREFTLFQAGGASDTNLLDVLHENASIARKNGESEWKIKANLGKKYIHHKLAHFIRFTFMKKTSTEKRQNE